MNIYTNKLRHCQTLLVLLLFLTGLFSTTCSFAQQKASQALPDAGSKVQSDPWAATDLLAPSDLARTIEAGTHSQLPLILSVGPAAMIKGSQDIGAAAQPENLTKLKETLDKLPKDKPIVIYCGCCPFAHCPNIRPAFNLIKKMHFTHAKLLNLEHNIRTDWIDKGYPTQQ
jgi:hypothetical protein